MLGVEELHKRRIIHRDIKPANILLTLDGDLMLSDFGLSRTFGRTAEKHPWKLNKLWTGSVYRPHFDDETPGRDITKDNCGTLGYMSPEMIRGEWYSFSSDVWALGVVLFEMQHGRVRRCSRLRSRA